MSQYTKKEIIVFFCHIQFCCFSHKLNIYSWSPAAESWPFSSNSSLKLTFFFLSVYISTPSECISIQFVCFHALRRWGDVTPILQSPVHQEPAAGGRVFYLFVCLFVTVWIQCVLSFVALTWIPMIFKEPPSSQCLVSWFNIFGCCFSLTGSLCTNIWRPSKWISIPVVSVTCTLFNWNVTQIVLWRTYRMHWTMQFSSVLQSISFCLHR